ncbi:MAG: hypothetical protein A2252_05970 [Elusimicrobia bacterium RIFOXYA2_FULL_39_19]|nr:MAG: hypothetical protein A2252_05970 [Elusimicrobia bacterium RIFOXYA2_FULL_39_19]
MKLNTLLLILLGLISVSVYINTYKNTFMWDDEQLIQEDRYAHSFTSIGYIFTPKYWINDFPGPEKRYRPLRMVTFMFDRMLWRDNVMGYHLTNTVMNTAVVLLVYAILMQMTKNNIGAFLGAVIFAVHPVHTETVAWVKNRTDILCCIFMLLSFWVFIRNEEKKFVYSGVLQLFFFIMALLSKEMAVILPAILMMYLITLKNNNLMSSLKKTSVYWFISILHLLFIFTFIKRGGVEPVTDFNFLYILGVAGQYVGLLYVPLQLFTERLYIYFVDYLFLALFAGALIYFIIKKKMFAVFALGWIFIAMLPVLYIEPLISRPIAEQRLYIPSVGLSMLISGYVNFDGNFSLRTVNNYFALFIVLTTILFSYMTISRNFQWESPLKFWSLTVLQSPESFRAHNNLAIAFERMNKLDYAMNEYSKALELYPESSDIKSNIGVVYYKNNDIDKAKSIFADVLKEESENITSLNGIAKINEKEGEYEKAIEGYSQIIKIQPYNYEAYNSIGVVNLKLGDNDKALEYFQKGLEYNKEASRIYYNIGMLYLKMNLTNESVEMFNNVLKYDNNNTDAMNNLGIIYGMLGKPENSVEYFKKTINLNPNYYQAHYNLGNYYLDKKMYPEALGEFSRVTELNTKHEAAKKKIEIIKKVLN